MDPDQDLLFRVYFPFNQGQVLMFVHIVFIDDGLKGAIGSRQNGLRSTMDKGFVLETVFDQILDGNDFKVVLPGKRLQVRHPGHGPVILHDLTNDPIGL